MLLYNNDGTVSSILAAPGPDGKMTSSAEVIQNVNTASSYGTANSDNFASKSHTTLSNVTPTPAAFGAIDANTAIQTKYPSSSYANFVNNNRFTVMIPADTTLDTIIDDRITSNIDLSHIADASLSPNVKTISAKQFGTTYSNGTVWVVGDDSKLVDVNLGNGFAIVGQQQNNRGWVKFGTNGPLWGHNGNQSTLPTPGDGLYAITGSLMVSSSKLMFYNGAAAGTNGWTAIK
jgi:hypothetical protein